MEYADIVIYSIIAIIIIFFIVRKSKKYKKGVIVANAKYVKNTKLYKTLLLKHRIYKFLTIVFIIVAIMSSAFLLARTKMTYRIGLKKNVLIYIEDVLSPGAVGRVYNEYKGPEGGNYVKNKWYVPLKDTPDFFGLIKQDKFKKVRNIVNKLQDENIGIVYRNNTGACYECYCKAHPNDKSCEFEDREFLYAMEAVEYDFKYPTYNDGYHLGYNYYLSKATKTARFPVVLSSFTDNYKYTNFVLDSIMKSNDSFVNFEENINDNRVNGLVSWGDIFTFSQFSSLPSVLGLNNSYIKESEAGNYIVNLYKSDKFSNKLSYLDFINERFENFIDNSDETKYVIWYTDVNKELDETTSDILNREKEYCDENNIKILSIDLMSEDEIVNTIKSNEKIKIVNGIKKYDASNIFVILITISSFMLFILDWRIRI